MSSTPVVSLRSIPINKSFFSFSKPYVQCQYNQTQTFTECVFEFFKNTNTQILPSLNISGAESTRPLAKCE